MPHQFDPDELEQFFHTYRAQQPKMDQTPSQDDTLSSLMQTMNLVLAQNAQLIQRLDERAPQPQAEPNEVRNASNNYHVMPDLTKSIHIFDGEHLNESSVWLEVLEATANLHQWPDPFKLQAASSHLRGAAKNWFETKRNEMMTWPKFRDAFRRRFDREEDVSSLWKQMRDRVQSNTESLSSYYHDKVRLCKRLNFRFSETKEQVVIGLRSREVASMIAARECDDEDELFNDLLSCERIINERRDRARGTSQQYGTKRAAEAVQTTTVKSPGPHSESQPVETSERRRLPARNEEGKPLCFACKQYGHVSKYCSRNRAPNNRPRTNTSNAETSIVNEIRVPLKQQSEFLKTVVLDDKVHLSAFVDTGSAICAIKQSVAKFFEVKPCNQPLYAFGNLNQPAITSLGKIMAKVRVDSATAENIELLVVPDTAQNTEVLVGRPFLQDKGVAFIHNHGKLPFGHPEDDIFKSTDPWKMYTVEHDEVVPPKRSQDVDVRSAGEQPTVLRIINTTDRPVKYEKDQILDIELPLRKIENEIAPPAGEIRREMINLDPNLDEAEIQEVVDLLNRHRECFALKLNELGKTDMLEMGIHNSGVPVRKLPYKFSQEDRATITRLIDELKETGIVTDTNSAYASPVLIVRKKNGEPRLVVDYRQLNKQTVPLNYPIPSIDEQFAQMPGCNIFATLDLANGYMQVPIRKEDRHKTAFITQDTTGEFTRLVFGLTNAPYVFVRLMNVVLGNLRNTICCCYLDDVIVPARNFDQMMQRLELVMTAFESAGLTLNLKKCEFGKREIDYLGFRVSENGIRPGPKKVESITRFPIPKNAHEVRRFLGLTGFFRRFIKNFAVIARPLSDLLQKEKAFVITQECASAFAALKEALTTAPVLALFDRNAPTELHTDACAAGIAGMLLQRNEQNELRLVYCVSKKTTECEKLYHSSRLELLAIVWSVERLRTFLIGVPFKIITDCQALVYLNAHKSTKPQVARWFSTLQEHNYDIEHRKGEKMAHIDALSRAPVEDAIDTNDSIIDGRLTVLLTQRENAGAVMMQQNDGKLRRLIKLLEKNVEELAREEARLVRDFQVEEGKLCKKVAIRGRERLLFVVPEAMRKSIVVRCHDLDGHFSVERTMDRILRNYWFPRMKRYVRSHIGACLECLFYKTPAGKQPGKLHPIPPTTRPFERLHIDHLGPFVKSTRGNSYILAVIDSFSRFTSLYAVRSTKTQPVLRCLDDHRFRFGVPKRIVSDRGTCFTADQFREYCEKHGIDHILNSPRHPRALGMIERVNRTVLPVIQSEMKDERQWDANMQKIAFHLNSMANKTTLRTPYEVVFGFNPVKDHAKVDELMPTEYKRPELSFDEIRNQILTEQEKYRERHDKKRFYEKYEPGEIVVVRAPHEATGQSVKLQPKYKGPFVVIETLPGDTYRIERLDCGEGVRAQITTAHVSQLKSYSNPNDDVNPDASDSSDTDPEPPVDAPQEPGDVGETSEPKQALNTEGRTRRVRRQPKKLQDYELTM